MKETRKGPAGVRWPAPFARADRSTACSLVSVLVSFADVRTPSSKAHHGARTPHLPSRRPARTQSRRTRKRVRCKPPSVQIPPPPLRCLGTPSLAIELYDPCDVGALSRRYRTDTPATCRRVSTVLSPGHSAGLAQLPGFRRHTRRPAFWIVPAQNRLAIRYWRL
jgi:hypothetical protein